jgi:hypothetical protein
MKKSLLLSVLLAIVAPSALAREFTPYDGPQSRSAPSPRSDVDLEYDGEAWYGWGTSPNWTDESVVNFQVPAGGPFVIAEVRLYVIGTEEKHVHFWDSYELNAPPAGSYLEGPLFSTPYNTWPPADWTNVDVTAINIVVHTDAIIGPGCPFYGTDDGIGLAEATEDGNQGHSWVIYAGGWEDDTYSWNADDGIRIGLNHGGGTPVEETTWGRVKSLYRR